jgi:eukaryotic-like serine/threonine-protein kinase
VGERDDRQTEEIGTARQPRPGSGQTPFLTAGARLRGRRYILERLLGSGGMAAVWLGRDERLERPVAIKVLSDTLAADHAYLARFEREAQVAARLSHPALVRVFDYGAERGRPFLVMEYISGGDLGERLSVGRPPDPDRLAGELLGALRHIHAAGVLHRDVKPQNVLLDRDERARLTDFGIAQPRDATSLTQTGMVLGTAPYLAPEVLGGEPPSERSDLYSLGVVVAEVIEVRGARPAVGELVEALRSHDPAVRPQSAAEALAALERTPSPPPDSTGPVRGGPPPRARPSRGSGAAPVRLSRQFSIAALAATALTVLAVAVFAGAPEPEPAPPASEPQAQQGPGEDETANRDGRDNEQGRGSEPPPEADGQALNDRGHALITQGRNREAIPVLERAVEALEGSGEITYAYALFNLGKALRLAGRPEEAIPILEARLRIPDQTAVVRAELEQARDEAGEGGEG